MHVEELPVPDGLLQLCLSKDRDQFTITVSGEIDLSNVHNLDSAVQLALSNAPCAAVTLDLGGVTFMDCAGLSALLGITSDCKENSAVLAIVNPRPCVRRLIALACLDGVLPVN